MIASAVQLAAGEALWPVVAGVKWIRFYHGMVATPIRAADVFGGFVVWQAIRTVVEQLGVPRRRRAARRDRVAVGRARGSRRRADRGRVLRAARRVLGDAGDRLRVPGHHAARDPAAVPVLGHVLPDLGTAELARAASRCSRRSGTASSSPDARPPATSRSGRCSRMSRSSSRSSSPAGWRARAPSRGGWPDDRVPTGDACGRAQRPRVPAHVVHLRHRLRGAVALPALDRHRRRQARRRPRVQRQLGSATTTSSRPGCSRCRR